MIKGVVTGDMGVGKDGAPGPNFQPGMELRAKYTLFAEGCRGHLGKRLEQRFDLRAGADPQVYGLGIKELWQVPAEQHVNGLVMHTAGWPLAADTYGGGFCYHYGAQQRTSFPSASSSASATRIPISRPSRNCSGSRPTRPSNRCSRAARDSPTAPGRSTAGGLQALPKLTFPGGALIGDDAGFLVASRIKGSHAAIKSGMLAAEAVVEALAAGRSRRRTDRLPGKVPRLLAVRRVAPRTQFQAADEQGAMARLAAVRHRPASPARQGALDAAPHGRPRQAASPPRRAHPIDYPKPDGVLTFDRLSSVFLSNTHHAEDQPCHLRLSDGDAPIAHNLALYDAPEQRYCPAGVYEIIEEASQPAPADQRAELRALQDLRHQGPRPEHRLGDTAGRRRADLSGDVRNTDYHHRSKPAFKKEASPCVKESLPRIIQANHPPTTHWLDLQHLAQVEITSEEAAHPIEAALLPGGAGWCAAHAGEQTIRILFDAPQNIRRVQLLINEEHQTRTQEFALRWSADGGQSYREIVRQQYNFNPGMTRELEDYTVELAGVTTLELVIKPEIGGGDARASVAQLRIA